MTRFGVKHLQARECYFFNVFGGVTRASLAWNAKNRQRAAAHAALAHSVGLEQLTVRAGRLTRIANAHPVVLIV